MKVTQSHETEVQKLLNDKDFAARIAGAVVRQANPPVSKRFMPYWAAAAAVVLLAAGVIWFAGGEKQNESYNGLTETSSRAIILQNDHLWQDTDNIINASLVGQ